MGRINKRVRIICPDGIAATTQILDAETGEPILNVTSIDWHLDASHVSPGSAKLTTLLPRLDIVTDAEIVQETPLRCHERERNSVYGERNKCISLIARMALKLGYRAGIKQDIEAEDGWKHTIYVDLPNGQVSWHIPDSELPLFGFLPEYEGEWDGHQTPEKYERVLNPGLE